MSSFYSTQEYISKNIWGHFDSYLISANVKILSTFKSKAKAANRIKQEAGFITLSTTASARHRDTIRGIDGGIRPTLSFY